MSSPSLSLRVLEEGDAQAWWNLRLEGLEGEPLAFGKSPEEHRETPVETIAGRFRNTNSGYFTLGAFDGDRLVAMATFMRDTGVRDRHKGHVYGVYVTPSHRGHGLAKELLKTLIGKAKQDATLEQITLQVSSHQPAAKRLYLSVGFTVYGTEPRALKAGSTYIDDDLMILFLHAN